MGTAQISGHGRQAAVSAAQGHRQAPRGAGAGEATTGGVGMSCEMTADGSRYLVRRSEMEALLSEREALAAHLERYRAAYVKLTNAECTQDADTGEYLRLVERKLMDEFDAIADETYTTSLARQKMLWQAEALESCAEKVAACS